MGRLPMQVVVERKKGRKLISARVINARATGFVPRERTLAKPEFRIEGEQLLTVEETVPDKSRRIVRCTSETRLQHWK